MHIHSQSYCIEISDTIHELFAAFAIEDTVYEFKHWFFWFLQNRLWEHLINAIFSYKPAFLMWCQQVELASFLLELQKRLNYHTNEHAQNAEISKENKSYEESLPTVSLCINDIKK
jgi:hypothetical protein